MNKLVSKIKKNYNKRRIVWKIKHVVYLCVGGAIIATIVGVVLAKFL